MNFDENFDEAVELVLCTWYKKDDPLHLNPHHPLGKLLGEWGELLDDYMKSLYKPGYEFKPQDELGDIWYYIRILCYQRGYKPTGMIFFPDYYDGIDQIISDAMECLIKPFQKRSIDYPEWILDVSFTVLVLIINSYNLTIDDLTASNWEKLKPGSERGDQWMSREKPEYVGGKIAKGDRRR